MSQCVLLGQLWQLNMFKLTTILIYKKGLSDEPSNFRPIALLSCIYKQFTSILSSHISNFAIKKDLISPEQKSAKPAGRCHEHSFTLQLVVADCKRNQKNCFVAFIYFIYLFINFSRQQKYKHIQTGRRFRNTNTA